MRFTPVSAETVRFRIVIVSVERPPWAMEPGANAFETAAAETDTTFALEEFVLATPPAPPVPVMLPRGMLFVNVSPVGAVAGRRAQMEIVHTPGAAPTPATMVPPVHERPASAAVGARPVLTPAAFVPVKEPPVQPGAGAVKKPLPASNSVIWLAPFAGRTSLKATPVTGPPEKLLIAIVNCVHCPGATFADAGPGGIVTVFATVSCAFAVSVADARGLGKFAGFVTALAAIVLRCAPSTVEVTYAVMVQLLLLPAVAPVRVIVWSRRSTGAESVPGAAPTPLHTAAGFAGAGTGELDVLRILSVVPVRLSANDVIGSALAALALLITIVIRDGWPDEIDDATKDFVTLIGVVTFMLLLNAALDNPRVFPIAPIPSALLKAVGLTAIVGTRTLTVSVHTPPCPITPPVRVTELAPAVAVTAPFEAPVPVQLMVGLAGLATCIPAGRLSTNVVRGIVTVALGFVRVTVSVNGVPASRGGPEKLLAPTGLLIPLTRSVALAGVLLKTSTPLSFAV